jgi:hypothetical protein
MALLLGGSTPAQAQPAMPGARGGQPTGMPDARMMSGIAMPMGDLPDGTVSVRVVRGEISNVLPKQTVELVVAGTSRTAQTDETGRAQFTGVSPGANAQAIATVDGERIESQPFTMAGKGGIRLLLAASGTGPSAAGVPTAAAVSGTVTFGGDSRIAIEFDDDALSVFYLLDVINRGAAPVNPASPLVFDLPADAMGASLLEGSSPQAHLSGRRVSIAGPFGPGRTTMQVGYALPSDAASRTLVQAFPAALDAVAVAAQKVGNLELKSAQLAQQQQVPAADGKVYVMGTGPSVAAGQPLTIELAGLPHHETWPRTISLVIALAILGGGAWTALGRAQNGAHARRHELEGRRDRLFADLLKLERAKRAGTLNADGHVGRRAELMLTLERIYGELDGAGPGTARLAPPAGGGRGLTA